MIIRRKLFSSKKLTPEEKRERAADQLDKNRKKVAAIHGGITGSAIAGAGLSASRLAQLKDNKKILHQQIKHLKENSDNYIKELHDIKSTSDKVREAIKKNRESAGNKFRDAVNSFGDSLKVLEAEMSYKKKAEERADQNMQKIRSAAKRLEDRVAKKASKRNKKILAGAALVGTGVGLASNQKLKKRAEKLRENKFSKTDDNIDNETYLGMGEEFDDSKFQRKSDKWLKERARYDGGLTDREKKNIRRNSAIITALTSTAGASLGLAMKKNPIKKGLIGAGVGAATGAGLAAAGHFHHKSDARKARKELERREKKDK